jgi:G:T-mismatch repair DNA endonuclease (very short patch repair protein)
MKVKRNKDRDARVNAQCRETGWKVIRIWEHEAIETHVARHGRLRWR